MRSHLRIIPAGLLVLGLAFAAPLAAQSDALEVSSGGFQGPRPIARSTVITRPGSYYLVRDLASDGSDPVITILADRVTLDLRGHSLSVSATKTSMSARHSRPCKNCPASWD